MFCHVMSCGWCFPSFPCSPCSPNFLSMFSHPGWQDGTICGALDECKICYSVNSQVCCSFGNVSSQNPLPTYSLKAHIGWVLKNQVQRQRVRQTIPIPPITCHIYLILLTQVFQVWSLLMLNTSLWLTGPPLSTHQKRGQSHSSSVSMFFILFC